MTGKRILMIVGDYAEDYETMVPFQALLAVGHTVHAVCPDKKAGRHHRHLDPRFRRRSRPISEKRGHNFAVNASFDDVKAETYDALVIPGGRAPEYLRLNSRVIEIDPALLRRRQAGRCGLPRRPDPRSRWRAEGADLLGLSGLPSGSRTGRRHLRGHRHRRRGHRPQSRHRPGVAGASGLARPVPQGAGHLDQPFRTVAGRLSRVAALADPR